MKRYGKFHSEFSKERNLIFSKGTVAIFFMFVKSSFLLRHFIDDDVEIAIDRTKVFCQNRGNKYKTGN